MPDAGSVTLAYVHDADVTYSFHQSLVNLLLFDAGEHGRIMAGGYNAVRCSRSNSLVESRNKAAWSFLETQDAEWLFWIDTDMGFTPDTLERLLEVADPVERPIVGALCFAQKETAEDGFNGYRVAPRPVILDWVDTPDGKRFMGRANYPVNTVVRCGATGSACIVIHRSVFQRIHAEYGPEWYTQLRDVVGQPLGEDVSFCVRAAALDIPIHVHTGVKTTHLKHQWLQEGDYWRTQMPIPASEQTAVVVPALRHTNAGRFMASLRASSGLASVYAIARESEHEAAEAWEAVGATIVRCEDISFSHRMNAGYRATDEPWIFVTGDDVVFRPGWLDHAQSVAGDQFDVIGTNDLGNPRVMRGEHATHLLIRRSYIDDVGASWDGPKILCHEGYRHWYVDDEIVTAAQQRGVWAMALGSVVEHMHPVWGKGDIDSVYRLGQESAAADKQLHLERRETYLAS